MSESQTLFTVTRGESPAFRHLSVVIAVAFALLAVALSGGELIAYPGWMWSGVGIVVAVQLIATALPWPTIDAGWVVAVPLASLAGLALFRVGTGGSSSMFGAIVVLPLIWIAIEKGLRVVVIAAAAIVVTLMMPFLCGTEDWANGQLVRVAFGGVVFTGVAIIVHDVARRARARLTELDEVSRERARLLDEAAAATAELSRTAEELRASEAFMDSVWHAIVNEGVVVTESDGRIVSWGPGATALLGYPAETMAEQSGAAEPRNVGDIVWPQDAEGSPARFARAVDAGSAPGGGDGELVLRTAAGDPLPVFLTCSQRHDAAGDAVGYIFVIHDARHAQEISRLKDEFVGTVSHELRTPLSSIIGYLELVAEEQENLTDDQKRFLKVAERNAHRLLLLVGDLLFIAQVEAGKLPIDPVEADLTSVAAASVESIEPVAARAGVTVRAELPDAPVSVSIDLRRVGQAVDNLLSNAVKFTPDGGTVTVVVRTEGDDAVIEVRDTGMGIPADELEQLTQRFFRARMATRQAIQGVGLGLSITKAIVTAHGGLLSASSTVGEGTTFEIRLPAQRERTSPVDTLA
ncbi:PAS domain-containing sensor histidine kinase [uncultured Microbacterium sp.]|uniref:histidine kinase n=1 Tax=uncultured Microbacterium sp. TaxID=191216 RepID=A0A1Y5P5J1_9MICO|nr:PAS domain-containing sensor histidine kinase [uncultured Microbacterium sp.]SBS72579.1 Signal transduction histidine kinase [uncultured Microbacterium sp.]